MLHIDVRGADVVQQAVRRGCGVLITPNHSFHYDSYVLFEAADRMRMPMYTMTAWQVFAMSNRFEQWAMQAHGCFSIDRERADMQAFRLADTVRLYATLVGAGEEVVSGPIEARLGPAGTIEAGGLFALPGGEEYTLPTSRWP